MNLKPAFIKKILPVIALAGLLGSSLAQAEYRVFVLKISSTSSDPSAPAPSHSFESTLDPDQYRGYFPLAANETITYTDTWRCFGRTDNRPHCPNPRAPAAAPDSAEGLDSQGNSPK